MLDQIYPTTTRVSADQIPPLGEEMNSFIRNLDTILGAGR